MHMAALAGRERRKFQRIPMEQIVSFAKLGHDDQLARGINLSAGGVSFQAVACEIDLGDRLNLTFSILGQMVSAEGTVVWATEVDPLTLEVGIEFSEIDTRGRALLMEFASQAEAEPDA